MATMSNSSEICICVDLGKRTISQVQDRLHTLAGIKFSGASLRSSVSNEERSLSCNSPPMLQVTQNKKTRSMCAAIESGGGDSALVTAWGSPTFKDPSSNVSSVLTWLVASLCITGFRCVLQMQVVLFVRLGRSARKSNRIYASTTHEILCGNSSCK